MNDRDKPFPRQVQEVQPGRQQAMDPKPETAPRHRGADRLRDKVAVITGGDSGIGRSVAEHFANEGAEIVIVYLEEDEDAQDAKSAVEAYDRRCLMIRGDVGDKAFCEQVIAQTLEAFGGIDILVNNASEQHIVDVDDHDDALMERTIRSNLMGTLRMSYAALPHLRPGGSIIVTTSITAYRGHPQLLDYATTKGGQVAFTRSLAQRVAERSLRVNAVAPGPIWTPLIPASFPPEKVESFGAQTALGRAGQPNEVAPCFVFLASDDASYMTGQVLHPNGGTVIGS